VGANPYDFGSTRAIFMPDVFGDMNVSYLTDTALMRVSWPLPKHICTKIVQIMHQNGILAAMGLVKYFVFGTLSGCANI
jgi:hypothetical protein